GPVVHLPAAHAIGGCADVAFSSSPRNAAARDIEHLSATTALGPEHLDQSTWTRALGPERLAYPGLPRSRPAKDIRKAHQVARPPRAIVHPRRRVSCSFGSPPCRTAVRE